MYLPPPCRSGRTGRACRIFWYSPRWADFFEVSLDALVGYTVQAHRRGDMVARIRQLVVQKKHTEATRAAREALRRYPNSFDVVYEATQAYGYSGMEQNRPEDLRQGAFAC